MIAEKTLISKASEIPHIQTSTDVEVKTMRVDINDLLARARKKNKQENFINLIFLGVFLSLILIVGIILSF